MTCYLKKNFQYNTRGIKFSLPLPKGGKKANDVILREDQKEYAKALAAHQRQKNSVDPFNLDFVPLEGASKHKIGKPMIGFGRKNVNEGRRRKR